MFFMCDEKSILDVLDSDDFEDGFEIADTKESPSPSTTSGCVETLETSEISVFSKFGRAPSSCATTASSSVCAITESRGPVCFGARARHEPGVKPFAHAVDRGVGVPDDRGVGVPDDRGVGVLTRSISQNQT